MKNPPPLPAEIMPSRIAGPLIAAGVVASALLVAWLPAEWWWRAAGSFAIGVYGVWLLRSLAGATTPRSVVAIEIAADLRATFTERDGRRVEGNV